MDYLTLVQKFVERGILKTPEIIEAFKKINRADFLLPHLKEEAGGDYALPLGFGQTISQPQVVAFMLELLAPKPGDKILDVGAGSGWTSALLAEIVGLPCPSSFRRSVGEKGKVLAVERIPELCEFGKKNISKYNFIEKGRVEFFCRDASGGLLKEAPFDKILVSAAAQEIPLVLREQLKIGGRLVLPVKNSIWLVVRKSEHDFEEKEFPGFVFVPLLSDKK